MYIILSVVCTLHTVPTKRYCSYFSFFRRNFHQLPPLLLWVAVGVVGVVTTVAVAASSAILYAPLCAVRCWMLKCMAALCMIFVSLPLSIAHNYSFSFTPYYNIHLIQCTYTDTVCQFYMDFDSKNDPWFGLLPYQDTDFNIGSIQSINKLWAFSFLCTVMIVVLSSYLAANRKTKILPNFFSQKMDHTNSFWKVRKLTVRNFQIYRQEKSAS